MLGALLLAAKDTDAGKVKDPKYEGEESFIEAPLPEAVAMAVATVSGDTKP